MAALAACGDDEAGEGASAAADESAESAPEDSSESSAEEPADDSSEDNPCANDASEEVRKVKLAVPFVSTLNSALWLAEGTGIFEDHGIEVETIEISGGKSLQAMLGGSVDMTIASATNTLNALEEGQEFINFAVTGSGFPQQVIIGTDAWEESGLTDDSTIEERIEYLKGEPWAVSSPTGSSATLAQYLFHLGGASEDDLNLVSMGSSAGALAGVESGQATVGSMGSPYPEVAEQDGYARTLIDVTGGEIPEITDIVSSTLVVTPEYYEENACLVHDFKEAVREGQQTFYDNPEESMEFVYENYFDTSPKEAVLAGMQNQMDGGSISPTPDISLESAEKLVAYMDATGEVIPDGWEKLFPDLG